ncbi:MAG: sodium:proton antiporter [Firmicutes bacterium]|nr:sodium:proton antiporter [Bacillota bacterium]
MKNSIVILLLILLSVLLIFSFDFIPEQEIVVDSTAEHIITKGLQETGSLNLVTAILYDYRAFDSMGESTVIFATVSAIVLLLSFKTLPVSSQGLSFIVKNTFGFLAPFIFLFGLYVITHGHLSPGGGFQGGVILSTISIILSIVYGSAYDYRKYPPKTKTLLETGGALLFLFIGGLGLVLKGYFLANVNPLINEPGRLISAGVIPYINIGIGFKIGAGLAIIFYSMIQKTYVEEELKS